MSLRTTWASERHWPQTAARQRTAQGRPRQPRQPKASQAKGAQGQPRQGHQTKGSLWSVIVLLVWIVGQPVSLGLELGLRREEKGVLQTAATHQTPGVCGFENGVLRREHDRGFSFDLRLGVSFACLRLGFGLRLGFA
jgi:hypothetical protein